MVVVIAVVFVIVAVGIDVVVCAASVAFAVAVTMGEVDGVNQLPRFTLTLSSHVSLVPFPRSAIYFS